MFLLMIAGLFLLGAVGEIVFTKTQIPDVVWLIAAGIVLGPVTGTVSRELLANVSPYFAALTPETLPAPAAITPAREPAAEIR
jgi:cell volume regulation protein A